MKKFILFAFLLTPLLTIAQQSSENNLEFRADSLTYEKGKKKPFTGNAISYFADGKKQTSTGYKKGVIEGKIESWYKSGAKQAEGYLSKGIRTGIWTAWYENGKKLRQGPYVNGLEEGQYTWWYENGNISKKGMYHAGINDGRWEWYYESGKLKQEGTLKGDKNDGLWKDYYEDGNLKMTGSFKNGVEDGEWVWYDEKGAQTTRKVYNEGLMVDATDKLDMYINNMQYYMVKRDFKNALANIDNAIALVDDKTENNIVYMGLAVFKAKVYSSFQHLDKAETVLLKAINLPDADITAITSTNYPPAIDELSKLATKISAYPETATKLGPHVVLAYLYNIVGDTASMRKEQQYLMNKGGIDWVVDLSLALYKIRGNKENVHGELQYIKEKIAREGVTRTNQVDLANNLLMVGEFTESNTIADKYLALDAKDMDFLFVKLNLAMAQGDFDKMKDYEKQILAINPKAFDE